MLPLIPLVAWALTAVGVGSLWWYYNLTVQQQAEADALAAEYASELFDKAVNQLSAAEARQVHGLVKRHFDN